MISDKQRGHLFVLVGPGGAGKNAIMHIALQQVDNLRQLATATTRPMRDGEVEGQHHLFLSLDEFQHMLHSGQLLEHEEVTPGRFYGIPRASVEDNLNAGRNLIADIDVNGARVLRSTYPDDATLIFITVPGQKAEDMLAVLQQRMLERNSEGPQVIQQRLDRAREVELPFLSQADHVIVNDDIKQAVADLIGIIQQHTTLSEPIEEAG